MVAFLWACLHEISRSNYCKTSYTLGMAKRADWEDPEVTSSHRHTTITTFTIIYETV